MIKFKSNFFYGWVIVAVMATISFVSMGLLSLNFGLFIKPMGEDLNIGRATFGFAQSAMMISSAISSPIIGRLIDRFGTRLLLPIAATMKTAEKSNATMATRAPWIRAIQTINAHL